MPEMGIAVGSDTKVVLIDLEGRAMQKLPDFKVAGNPGAPGIWLKRGWNYFRLAPRRSLLIPVPRRYARAHMYQEPDVKGLRPPPGTRMKGLGIVGHWRYAYESGFGVTLAQWSGECEVPTAYWVAAGSEPAIITGERNLSRAPNSIALGWSPNGEAVVLLEEAGCGSSSDTPGIYLFSSPGEGRPLFRARGYPTARMWGRP